MSLIFTSNTQDEYDGSLGEVRSNIGIENPADYHNHLTSPLEVKPNSQIAVQSVKITRKEKWDFNDVGELLYYFGKPLGTTLKMTDVTSRPKLLQVPRGTYGTAEFASELETQMKRMKVSPAVHQNFSVNTSFVLADFKGFEISCSQNGGTYSGVALTDIDNSIADVVVATTNPVRPVSNNFTVANALFSRTGAAGDINDGLCCGILNDFPLAMGQDSSFITDFQGASFDTGGIGVNGNASWVIGLTRPTTQLKNEGEDIGIAPQGFKTDTFLPHFFDYVAVFSAENGSRATPSFVGVGKNAGGFTINSAGQIESEFDASDAAVPSGTLKLYQGSYKTAGDGKPLPSSYRLNEILYYGGAAQPRTTIITNADILGSAVTQFTKIEFSVLGDEVRVNMVQRNGTKVALLNSKNNAEHARNFKPTTDFTTALYPKMILSHNNSTLDITAYTTYSATSGTYKYPTYTGYNATDMSGGLYTVGDSSYANAVSYSSNLRFPADSLAGDATKSGQAPSWSRRGLTIIKPPDTTYGQMTPTPTSATNVLAFVGLNDDSEGVDYQHLLVLEDTTPVSGDLDLGNYYSEKCSMSRYLGFPNIRVLDQSFGTLSLSDKQISWVSSQVPIFNVNSAFVRLSNLTQRSYNATKNSISKMLYHIPRFTNDGRQFGDLFYEVSERTYVDLGNTDSFMLNQFQVSICDKNEKIVDDLSEDTIVVFHIREKSQAGKYS